MSQATNNLAAYIRSLADLLRVDFNQSQYGRITLIDPHPDLVHNELLMGTMFVG